MTRFESLLDEALEKGLNVEETWMPSKKLKGFCANKNIYIDPKLTDTEKACVLAEEIAHYEVNNSNILNLKKMDNLREERKARKKAYERLVPLKSIIKCYEKGCQSLYEMSDMLDLTEEFLIEALNYYRDKCGIKKMGEYTIIFDPLVVIKELEKEKG